MNNRLIQRVRSANFRSIIIVLIAFVYFVLSFFYAILTPPWESPDEPAHYLYVSQLAARWRPPEKPNVVQTNNFWRDQAYISSNYEWFQPALGYLPTAVVYKILTIIRPEILPKQMPLLISLFPEISNRYSLFLHVDPRILHVWDGAWGLLILRLLLSLLGLPVIFAVYRLGCLLDKENGLLGIVAAGWVAFLPQFTFINASIRDDTLANAIASLVFLIAARMQISTHQKNRNALVIGSMLGLGLISKNTFFYVVPIGLTAIIFSEPREPRNWIRLSILMLTPTLIVFWGYYLSFAEARAQLAYTFGIMLKINPDLLTWKHLQEIPEPLLIDLFYARFGWANVAPPAIWSRFAFGFWAIGSCISFIQVIRFSRNSESSQQVRIIVLLFIGIFLSFSGAMRFNLAIIQPQGRFLFPALVPWAILCFWGIWQKLPERGEKTAMILIVGFMLLFNIYALLFTLIPAYY